MIFAGNLDPVEQQLMNMAYHDADNREARNVLADWYTDRGRHTQAEAWWLLATGRKRPGRRTARTHSRTGYRCSQVYWLRCPSDLLVERPFDVPDSVFRHLEDHWLIKPKRGQPHRAYRGGGEHQAVWAAETDFVQAWCKAKEGPGELPPLLGLMEGLT